MWGIILTDARGRMIDRILVDAPIEAMRDWCRRILEARPDAARAALESSDDSFAYAWPEDGGEV